ncbi:MAG: phytoene/squalene synthase family protein [Planctomycetota bacterium]
MTMPSTEMLSAAYESCRRITSERAKSFYLGLRLAPEPKRSSLYALYAWNRLGDDIADDPSIPIETRRMDLSLFADRTSAACAGSPPDDEPVWKALSDTAARYPIDPQWLTDMIDGLRSDLDSIDFTTEGELRSYCDRVAGSVGRCCVAIWGVRRESDIERAVDLASRLGFAFQMTNVLRDVGEDASLDPRRCYLPQAWLDDAGLSLEALLAWRDPVRCETVIRRGVGLARDAYRAGVELGPLISPRCRPTLWAMTRVYERTLDLIEADPSRAVRRAHVRPGRSTVLGIAAKAVAMSVLAGRGGVA